MKIYQPIIAAFLIFAVLTLTACPKAPKTIRTLREKSSQLSIYGTKIIQANSAALDAKEISPELFKTLTAATDKYVTVLGAYRAGVSEAESVYNNTRNLPAGTVDKLQKLLDVVVTAFIELTTQLNLVSGSQADTIKSIVAGVQLTILALRGAFSEVRTHIDGGAKAWA